MCGILLFKFRDRKLPNSTNTNKFSIAPLIGKSIARACSAAAAAAAAGGTFIDLFFIRAFEC
jgi:hypothetical protein